MPRMATVKKRKTKKKSYVPPLPEHITVGGAQYNAEHYVESGIMQGLTAEEIKEATGVRSLASIEKFIAGRSKEDVEKKYNTAVRARMYSLAMLGDRTMIKLIAEGKMEFGSADLEGTPLPQPLIINIPKR